MTSPLRVDVLDLSNWQTGTERFAIAAHHGLLAVVHKATEGTGFIDGLYAHRRDQVDKYNRSIRRRLRRRRRLLWGAYHFARPTTAAGDATRQARWFLQRAQLRPGDLVPVLDLETYGDLSTAQLTSWVGEWCGVMRAELGTPGGILYTQHDLDDHHDAALWCSAYSTGNTPPRVPRPWKGWDLWQFSDSRYGTPHSEPGIVGGDLSTVAGATSAAARAHLEQLLIGAPQTGSKNVKRRPRHRTFLGAAVAPLAHAAAWARAHHHPRRAGAVSAILSKVRALLPGRRRRKGT